VARGRREYVEVGEQRADRERPTDPACTLWYCAAVDKALDSRAARKYFEHTGALLTADGTDDHLIKLEGVPKGEQFSWEDDPFDAVTAAAPTEEPSPERETEPEDVCPPREDTTAREGSDDDDGIVDSEDESDDTDPPPGAKEPPPGFSIVPSPPSAEMLAFSKDASPADALVGRSILFNWPVVGWCVGVIKERNTDGRYSKKLADGTTTKQNFRIYYEIDGETIGSVLRADEYSGSDEFAWVLLEKQGGEVQGGEEAVPAEA
jgi:hypothetical protein